ncbi:MAG: PEP-CTERM sorting domain-containing protein [Phycisphaerales bacterium]|nr:PEP-CTERM sorting domain-containing protein [Phycisphaerales bacterium]
MSRLASGVALSLTILGGLAARGAEFRGLGQFPGHIGSAAVSISRHGTVVTGWGLRANGDRVALAWLDGSVIEIGDLPGGARRAQADAATDDGSVIVGGASSFASGYTRFEAFRWAKGTLTPLGFLEGGNSWSFARDVSADGTVIVGSSSSALGSRAVVWHTETVTALPPATGDSQSTGLAVSADGSVVVGSSWFSRDRAVRWVHGQVELLPSAPAHHNSYASDVSADGTVIVGSTLTSTGQFATIWEAGVPRLLGDLPGGAIASLAHGVSADGGVVVGWSDDGTAAEPFVWTSAAGMRSLRELLLTDFGLDIGAWQLESCHAVSDDGLRLVGTGFNPAGQREAWMAIIPEPSGLIGLLALGAITLRHRPQ